MALPVTLPLPIRHLCTTPDSLPVRGLLLEDEAVVLTSPPAWEGVCFTSLTGASRFVSGKPYAGASSFVFCLDAVGAEVAALLAGVVKGELASFAECEVGALLTLAYQGRVALEAAAPMPPLPPLRAPGEAGPRPPGRFPRGTERVARLRREVRRPPKAQLQRGGGVVGVTSPVVACRPDSVRARRERKQALFQACDDGTPFGVFVALWFADESNWLPEEGGDRAPGAALPPALREDVASMRRRIEIEWEGLSSPQREWVEAEWMRRRRRAA